MILDYPSNDLSKEIARKYGYDEFIIRRWLHFFGEDTLEIIRTFESGVPKYIRVNTLKAEEGRVVEKLRRRGFEVARTDLRFCYEILHEPFSIGATPEFLMGYYYIMDKSSCIPPLALSPKPTDIVADLAASPGGKTTFLSQLMENRGVVLAVEPQEDRLEALIHNVNRMGALNVAIFKMDARDFAKMLVRRGIQVDKVLLDAPCTGEGIIHKDKSRKTSRGRKDIEFCSILQKDLILSAFDILKDGGYLVYSTCSLAPEENEYVVNFLLEERDAEVVDFEVNASPPLNLPGLEYERIRFAKRLYPHVHRCSGFFIAKIRKLK